MATRSTTSRLAGELGLLSATSLVFLATIVINGLAAGKDATKYGFKNSTGDISDIYSTQVTPASFTFAIWGVIYTWQILWIAYGWSFVCRPATQRTIHPMVYVGFIGTCILNIIWIYLWGNEHIDAALPILILFQDMFYPTIVTLAVYLEKIRSKATKVDVFLTRVFPLNGLCFYATWTTIASLINLAVVTQYSGDLSAADSGTLSLVLLTLALLVYFVLENTVFNGVLRYVFSVYPVVIWALIGVLDKQWDQEGTERNSIFALVLLIVSVILFVMRMSLVVLFSVFLPLKKSKYTEV